MDDDDDFEMSSEYDVDDDASEDFADFDEPQSPGPPAQPFRCVEPDELRRMQADDVQRVAERLPKVDVAVLLRAHKWDCERVVNSYFENPEGVLSKAGVCEQPPAIRETAAEAFRCPICLEPQTAFTALGCGHRACTPCYSQYIAHKIKDEGPACISARCPSEKCAVLITDDLVHLREFLHGKCVVRVEHEGALAQTEPARSFTHSEYGKLPLSVDCLAVPDPPDISKPCRLTHV